MDKFLTFLENSTSRYLTRRKAKKLTQKAKGRTVLGEIWSWIDALIFAIFWVIIINQYLFQLFVIPSPSMVSTLLVGDRVIVNKDAYGVELYPAGKKVGNKVRRVERDNIITFYNPEYDSKGPFFDVLSQIIYMGTLTMVNIDKNADGTPAERLYVKRAVGFPGDIVKFENGNAEIKLNGTTSFVPEEAIRNDLDLSKGPNRSVDANLYPGLEAAAIITAYQEINQSPSQRIIDTYLNTLSDSEYDYVFDSYEFNKVYSETKASFDPSDMTVRSDKAKYQNGIYVPEDYILPLGDNRDNSYDGRYFGPVAETSINGRVIGRFWPLNRIGSLVNK